MESRQILTDLERAFVPPARLAMSRPRNVRLTLGGRALVGLALLLMAGAVVALVALTQESRRQAANRQALVDRGVTTTGVVTRLWRDGDDRRRVVYRFSANGRSFTSSVTVSAERRRSLEVGSPITVRFVPGNPAVNDLGGRPRAGLPAAIAPMAAVGLAACGALCLLAIRYQRRLLEDGRVAPAVVTGHTSKSSSHGGQTITYEFLLLSGAIANGRSGMSGKPPAEGTVITVIYDPERPTRSRVYPLALVTPA